MTDHTPHPDPASDSESAGGASTGADDAQLHEVRTRLLRDAAAAGIHDEHLVHTAIDRATALYADATVRSFISVLVERTVRQELSISTTHG
jgi:hypothetical protein